MAVALELGVGEATSSVGLAAADGVDATITVESGDGDAGAGAIVALDWAGSGALFVATDVCWAGRGDAVGRAGPGFPTRAVGEPRPTDVGTTEGDDGDGVIEGSPVGVVGTRTTVALPTIVAVGATEAVGGGELGAGRDGG